GWDVIKNIDQLKKIIAAIKSMGIRVSVFLNAEFDQVHAAKESGTDRIELYTGPYAQEFISNREAAIKNYSAAANAAYKVGLGINAGHDLNLQNLKYFKQQLIHLDEVSIGHALISDALYLGIENAIQLYKRQLAD
ncbi:MAG: pyridoxine 5'-phosphate synthase, partial [Chitinophagales bacterium]